MGSLLASPRRRRRLAWLGAVGVVALSASLSFVFLRNTAPPHKEKFVKGAPQVDREPAPTKHTRHEVGSALTVAAEFLRTAILREHVDRSWAITDPSLRAGYSRHEWNSGGSLPFPPYHFREVRWKPDYSFRDSMGFQVALFPDKTERQRPTVFLMDLKRYGAGKREHWLVSYFEPTAPRGSAPPAIDSGGGLLLAPPPPGGVSPLGAAWLLVPISGLSLIVLIPLVLGIRGLVRNRRAVRAYEAGRLG
jgi:hypothetical protein